MRRNHEFRSRSAAAAAAASPFAHPAKKSGTKSDEEGDARRRFMTESRLRQCQTPSSPGNDNNNNHGLLQGGYKILMSASYVLLTGLGSSGTTNSLHIRCHRSRKIVGIDRIPGKDQIGR